jgi:hypothetical protein
VVQRWKIVKSGPLSGSLAVVRLPEFVPFLKPCEKDAPYLFTSFTKNLTILNGIGMSRYQLMSTKSTKNSDGPMAIASLYDFVPL